MTGKLTTMVSYLALLCALPLSSALVVRVVEQDVCSSDTYSGLAAIIGMSSNGMAYCSANYPVQCQSTAIDKRAISTTPAAAAPQQPTAVLSTLCSCALGGTSKVCGTTSTTTSSSTSSSTTSSSTTSSSTTKSTTTSSSTTSSSTTRSTTTSSSSTTTSSSTTRSTTTSSSTTRSTTTSSSTTRSTTTSSSTTRSTTTSSSTTRSSTTTSSTTSSSTTSARPTTCAFTRNAAFPNGPTSNVCYDTSYYSTSDQGSITASATDDSQLMAACRMICSGDSRCAAYVAQAKFAADSNAATGTCFFYDHTPAPRSCSEPGRRIDAENKTCS